MVLRSFGMSNIGMVRETNQDNLIFDDKIGLYIVADGMGGHAAGEQASQSAVQTIYEILSEYDFKTGTLRDQSDSLPIEEVIKYAFQEANDRILLSSLSNSAFQGMGTTATVAIYNNNFLYIGHVGDSRIYLIRNRQISQLSKDHSVVQQLVDVGVISQDEAQVHPYKNVITKCLGMQSEVEGDTFKIALMNDDRIVMCTDGLSNLVTDEQIKEIVLRNNELEKACTELINTANERGGPDNITVVLIHNEDIYY